MPDYRLYCLNGHGRIHLADWVQANSDDEAVAKAREMHPHSNCELWLSNRLVAKLDGAAHS